MWKPVIVDTARKQDFSQKISEIAEVLYESSYRSVPAGLLTGSAGVALFFYHYWLWSRKERYYEKALEALEACIDFCRKNGVINSFCNGAAGIGWCLKYFEERDTLEGSVSELVDELFPSLYLQMIDTMKAGKYDFLHEALGIALCCYKNEPQSRFLDEFLDVMHRVSKKNDNGIAWYSAIKVKEVAHNVVNLSISHGQSAIVSFLCKISKMDKVLPLLLEATRFIVNQRQDQTIYTSCFPSIQSETFNYRTGRLAWCQGDLGTAHSLLRASNILNHTAYRDMAMQVLLHSSQRREIKKGFVQDAGICHGSAGIAHIFNRVYQNTGDDAFKEAALYWMDDCLRKSCFNDGLAGYKVWRKDGWITLTGILEGIAGIGLVLLAAISDIEPDWDECLLLS